MSNVSIVFQNTDDARGIISAILADNPAATAHRYPAMVKIDCPERLVINQHSVSTAMGREFDLQEIHLSLVNISGSIDEDDDRVVLSWNL